MSLIGRSIAAFVSSNSSAAAGWGEVCFLGMDGGRLRLRVAVKAVRGERVLDVGAKRRFLREARILSQLEHPNICRIYDFIEVEGDEFIILELVQGENLRQILGPGLSPVRSWTSPSRCSRL